jgi:hypothetical protein
MPAVTISAATAAVNPPDPFPFWTAEPDVIAGKSPATREQSDTVVAAPHVPMTWCEESPVADVIASVPEVVTGEPETWSHEGTVCATLVTVPVPALPIPRKLAQSPTGPLDAIVSPWFCVKGIVEAEPSMLAPFPLTDTVDVPMFWMLTQYG